MGQGRHTSMRRFSVLAVLIALGAAVPLSAQSLADVARAEAARRAAIKTPGKVYTNDSLKGEPGAAPASEAAPATGPAAAAAAPQATPKAADKDKAAADAKNDEATWRKRIADERQALDRAKMFADALQSRINALTTDFANRDDPVQRQQIGDDRNKALAELDRVKKEIDDHTKAIADIQEDARKAGVPAGWVR